MNKDSIVLIGMAGVGKSTVGRRLSEVLDYHFVDLDDHIAEKFGLAIQEIINRDGESAFLEKEKQCMYEVELNQAVVAPGGSIVYHSDLMADLNRQVFLIYLEDSLENISGRIGDPFRRGIVGMNDKSLEQIFDERVYKYEGWAHVTIDCRGKLPEMITEEITQWLQEG
jgi:shikimate kinase